MIKTNAIRILETEKVNYTAYEYDFSDGKIDGVTVAGKIGIEAERVFKTLVTVGKMTGINVFVIPVQHELDLKKAATAAGDKNIEMIKSKELEPQTGYIHGGCSPVGMKKKFPTYFEETAELFEKIIVSGGKIGLQVEVSPNDLIRVTGGKFCDLVR
jgi:Cys-tRNA(Pro)/Cys-tRNA(Cys) deacylase